MSRRHTNAVVMPRDVHHCKCVADSVHVRCSALLIFPHLYLSVDSKLWCPCINPSKCERQVLAALDEKVYDIILMDIHMPEMDGLEASQIIQQRFAPADRPRIVALSADTLQARAVILACSNVVSGVSPAATVAMSRCRGRPFAKVALQPSKMKSRSSEPDASCSCASAGDICWCRLRCRSVRSSRVLSCAGPP